jgi:GT2 family glycosyltransferase
MRLTLAIPVMNQLEDTKGMWGCHIANIRDKENVELLVIDNGSTDGTQEFLNRYVFPYFPNHKLVHNQENVGVLKSMNQCIKESSGDVIAILHNDVYVLEYGWDDRIMQQFKTIPKLGLAGFLGAQGVGWTGGRQNTFSNMLEAEIHGARERGQRRVAIFDGLSLIGRREMFEAVGGFDEGYTIHHFYDRDISLRFSLCRLGKLDDRCSTVTTNQV